jgi:stress-induced morphogen
MLATQQQCMAGDEGRVAKATRTFVSLRRGGGTSLKSLILLSYRGWFGPCMMAIGPAGACAMAMAATDIERLIREAFPDAIVVIEDLAGDGDHYSARVTSAAFAGKSRVQQHQMVYSALKGEMGGALHALALETMAT